MLHANMYVAASLDAAAIPEHVRVQGADVVHFTNDAFGFDDARSLQVQATQRPVTADTREFVLHFSSITNEAQNALLKLFEDPPETARFHVVVERADMLLPTVRSRLHHVASDAESIDRTALRDFLKMDHGKRMSEIAARTKAKDTKWIEAIAAGTEEYAMLQKGEMKIRLLTSILFVRQYLGSRGSSPKMLLEEIALTLPAKK